MVKVNLQGQELMTFEAVPPGTYRVSVDRAEERTSQASSEPNIFWLFRISEVIRVNRPDAIDDPSTLVNRTIMHGTSLTEKALWNLYRTLIALGEDPEEVGVEDYEFDPEDFVGRECVVQVTVREYPPGSGVMTNQIQNIRSLSEVEAGTLA